MSARERRRPWWGPRRGDLVAELEAAAVATATGAELAGWLRRFGFTLLPDGAGGVMTLVEPGSFYAENQQRALPRGSYR